MKVIVRTIEYGGVTRDIVIEDTRQIWIDREDDCSLRLYVWLNDGSDLTLARFASGSWRGVWPAEAVTAESDQPIDQPQF